MPTNDLASRHPGAGKRYAAAVDELIAALVDLAAIERALPADPLQSFEADVPDQFPALRHRQFVPTLPKSIRALVQQRAAEISNPEAVR